MRKEHVIAQRIIRDLDMPGIVYRVLIGKPAKASADEWRCLFKVDGVSRRAEYAYGGDALQALHMAIEGVRTLIETSGRRVAWLSDEPGDHMIPRFIPYGFGPGFSKIIEQNIEREISRLAARAKMSRESPSDRTRRRSRNGGTKPGRSKR